MNNELVINVTSSDIYIALLEDNRLVELNQEKRNLKDCIDDLSGIVNNIEGPLQKVIEDATKQMDNYKSKTLYQFTETKPIPQINKGINLELEQPVKQTIYADYTVKPYKYTDRLKYIYGWLTKKLGEKLIEIVVGIFIGVAILIIQKKFQL